MSAIDRKELQIKARKAVLKCDWSLVAKEHWENI